MLTPMDDLTSYLLLLSGGTGLRDDRVGELLGKCASSSPWAHHLFLVAVKVIGPSVHKKACHTAVAQYSFVYDIDDEMGASRGREKHPCFYNASGSF